IFKEFRGAKLLDVNDAPHLVEAAYERWLKENGMSQHLRKKRLMQRHLSMLFTVAKIRGKCAIPWATPTGSHLDWLKTICLQGDGSVKGGDKKEAYQPPDAGFKSMVQMRWFANSFVMRWAQTRGAICATVLEEMKRTASEETGVALEVEPGREVDPNGPALADGDDVAALENWEDDFPQPIIENEGEDVGPFDAIPAEQASSPNKNSKKGKPDEDNNKLTDWNKLCSFYDALTNITEDEMRFHE
ncbi:unnamed protein product, partial [Amoebophrya sp. A25]